MARWRVAGRRVARWLPHRCHGSPAAGAGRVRDSAVAATPRLGWRLGRRCRCSGGRAVSDRTAGARRLNILPSDRERPILPPGARLPHRRRFARAVAPEHQLYPRAPAREPFRRVAWSGTVRHSPAQRGPSDTSAEAAPVPTQSESNPLAGFGPNEWLVEEIYQQYLADPDSVDAAWHDFFADYRRNGGEPAENSAQVSDQPDVARKPAAAGPESAQASEAPPGPAARVVANMESSLAVPTATSVRSVPAKLLIDNRTVINHHLARSRGGKVSFTHLIGYALVQALGAFPEMNAAYTEVDGKPALVTPEHVNLGLAIDLPGKDGSRSLVVAAIKGAEAMDFTAFWAAYEEIVRKARNNKLTIDDFAGTTISLTNPGTIGTVHSVPRLMAGQGAIIGVGAMEYPAEHQGASAESLARLAVSKVLTLTSTYDHRIIQGAQSGDFLRCMHELLLGDDGLYDEVFRSLRIPYEPVRWVRDIATSHEDQVGKPARVIALIHAFRVRGHLMADTDPLDYKQRSHPDLDIVNHGLTLWDLDREFATGGFGGKPVMALREILGVLRDSYCRTVGVEYMHIQDPEQRDWLQDRVEKPAGKSERAEQLHILERLNAAEAFEAFLQTKYVGQKRFSLEGGESSIPLLDAVLTEAAHAGLDEVAIGLSLIHI